MSAISVLLVGGLNRCGLAVARALKMAGNYETHVTSLSQSPLRNVILGRFKSRSMDRLHIINGDYQRQFSVLLDELIKIITRHGIDALIPISHPAVISLSREKARLERHCRILVEDYEKLIRFHDKSKTVLLARELDVPHPLTDFPEDLGAVRRYCANATFPVVIKARKGTAAKGVWYANNAEQLESLFQQMSDERGIGEGFVEDRSNPMLQEHIPGELHDAAVFCVDGEMKAGLTQKRIMTRPLPGGPGIVNITTRNEELLEYARRIIGHIRWTGVLLFDFKIDERDGKPKLLEINPRFWGTTWLTICAGLNYPHYLVQHSVGQPVEIPIDYSVGLMCRWPFAEIATILERPVTLSEAFERAGGFLSRFRDQNVVYDILHSDIRPVLGQVVAGFLEIMKKTKRVRKPASKPH